MIAKKDIKKNYLFIEIFIYLPKGGIEPPFESYKETVLPIKLFRL